MIERGPWVSNFKLGSAATYNLLLQVKRMEETPKTDREREGDSKRKLGNKGKATSSRHLKRDLALCLLCSVGSSPDSS